MHEVQSVINRTLALQLPKEYPELADSNTLPDSSTRLTSPSPSSATPSPAPQYQRQVQDFGTQTEPTTCCSTGCQAEFGLVMNGVKEEEEVDSSESGAPPPPVAEKKGRGCPKGGWPNKKKKKKGDSVQSYIKKFLELAIAGKKERIMCEICSMPFKKIYKLKLHLMKDHSGDLSALSQAKKITKQQAREEEEREEKPDIPPERKSTRHREGEENEEMFTPLERAAPAHLIRAEGESWTEGSEYFCMLCSQSFTAFGIYKHHIGDTHGMLMEDYRAKYGRVGEVINKYNCKICQEDVIHKFTNIKLHMRSIHDMTVVEYSEIYHPKKLLEADVKGEKEKDNVSNSNQMQVMPVQRLTSCSKETVEDAVEDEASETGSELEGGKKRWYEGCSYTCVLCNKHYDIYFSYHGHLKKIHNMSMEQYHSQYGQEGEVNRYYACKICHTNIVWRLFNIRKHMESTHELTLHQYGAAYEGISAAESKQKPAKVVQVSQPVLEKMWYEGPDQYKCLICNGKITHKYNNIASHMTLIHDLSMSEYEKELIANSQQATDYLTQHDAEYSEEEEEEIEEEEVEQYKFTEADIIIENPEVEEADEDEESIDDAEENHLVINEDPTEESEQHAWYHGSNLTCQICNKTFANDQWYFHHFSKIHGITKEKYNEMYGKQLEQWTQYGCLICGNKIRWKYSSIRQHLKQVHNTTIQDYEATYMDGGEVAEEEEEQTVEPLEALQEQARNPCLEVPPSIAITHVTLPPPPPLKAAPGGLAALAARRVAEEDAKSPTPTLISSPTPPSLAVKSNITFDTRPDSQWYHGSDLTCEICQKTFVDFTYYCTHIRTVHNISKEQFNEKYGTAKEMFRLYRCLVCGISVKWTYQSICGHLKSHDIPIKEYETKYRVLDNQNTESGKISDLMHQPGVVMESGEPSSKKQRVDETDGLPPLVVNLPKQEQHQGKARGVYTYKPERIHAETSSPTGKWYNQCKFTCKACPEEKYFTVPQALRMHLNGIHSMSRKQYEGIHGSAETITRYWTCLICNKELKCQKGIIIQHLLNVHAMELVDYERQYMDAGDQVVARETKRPRKKRMVNPMTMQAIGMEGMAMQAIGMEGMTMQAIGMEGMPMQAIGMEGMAMQAIGMEGMNMNISQESNESFNDPDDLSQFLVQRMDEGSDSLSIEGPAVTGEVSQDGEEVTSVSKMEVEGMDHVPWYFGCRYSCQICQKVWHYPQAARYHLDSVHKLTRAAYESQYGTCEVETRIFHCSICQRSMKCERDIIKYHLEAKHSMSLEEYIEQCPVPVVTIGESRRSNAATHARGNINPQANHLAVSIPGMPQLQRFPQMNPEVVESYEKGAPWYRGSNFTCIPCQRPFGAQVSYISHINSKHGMNLREYREQYGSIEEIRQYQCKVPSCTRYVSWTYSGINDHLKSHSLSMMEYEAQFLGIGVGVKEPVEQVQHMQPEDFSTVVKKWSSGSGRDCNICKNKVLGSHDAFVTHLLERHQITESEYSSQHGEVKGQTHVCHICQENVMHDQDSLKEHVKTHGITIEHYYHKFIKSTNTDATNAELIISKVSSTLPMLKIVSSQSPASTDYTTQAMLTPATTTSTPMMKVGETVISKVVSAQPMLKSVSPTAPPVLKVPTPPSPMSASSIKVRKNHWANGCSYQCIMCKGQKYPEEFMFKKHILTSHNMSTEEYQNNFGNPALVKQLHICKVTLKNHLFLFII